MPPLVRPIPEPGGKFDFPRRQRLTHAREYQAVYGAKVRKSSGLLLVYGMPNGRTEHRLGLAIHRRVGTAVVRNRIKRLVREAFRLGRNGYPLLKGDGGVDFIVQVKPHEPVELNQYQEWLRVAVAGVLREVERREGKRGAASDTGRG